MHQIAKKHIQIRRNHGERTGQAKALTSNRTQEINHALLIRCHGSSKSNQEPRASLTHPKWQRWHAKWPTTGIQHWQRQCQCSNTVQNQNLFLCHMSDIRYQTYQISYQSHQGASKKIKVCLVSSRDLSAGNTEVKPHTPRFLKKQTCSWRGHISCVPFPAPPRSFQHRTVKTDHPTLTLHVLLHQQLWHFILHQRRHNVFVFVKSTQTIAPAGWQ